jgi:hypothetical protein
MTRNDRDFVQKIFERRITLGNVGRTFDIAWKCSEKTPGYFAEFGVFKGGIAVILIYFAIQQDKQVHLFDTFEGLPDFSLSDKGINKDHCQKGLLTFAEDDVLRFFLEFFTPEQIQKHVVIHRGVFDEESRMPDGVCALAHVDFDLHDGIYAASRKVYRCLHDDGVIIIHGYHNQNLLGVKRACDTLAAEWGDAVKMQYRNECLWVRKVNEHERETPRDVE